MSDSATEPAIFVVFGGTGDLMRRKLLPNLWDMKQQGALGAPFVLLSVALDPEMDDVGYRNWVSDALQDVDASKQEIQEWAAGSVYYEPLGDAGESDYARLAERIRDVEEHHSLPGNRVFYLALPPQAFESTIEGLGHAGLNTSPGWTRLVIEKPFGHDIESARQLNKTVHNDFDESQIYRIDHYLGKETVQNLLIFRFANMIFESLWHRDRIANVQITVAEDLGVEGRRTYYDKAGALRDMLQNHVTQLLALIAMDAPVGTEADAIRDEKVRVLRSVAPLRHEDAVYGQYEKGTIDGDEAPGYREAPGVPDDSKTETFIALELGIENWRWQGVPFYIRTGKRLPRKLTEIAIVFKQPPVCFFRSLDTCAIEPNVLRLRLQPEEAVYIAFEVKTPGQPVQVQQFPLQFCYGEIFGKLPDAYQTLILDILKGDQTLFVRADEAEAAWSLYGALLEDKPTPSPYPAGSWGPPQSEELLHAGGWQSA